MDVVELNERYGFYSVIDDNRLGLTESVKVGWLKGICYFIIYKLLTVTNSYKPGKAVGVTVT